ncbi:hypothetical protein GY45DRAFT_53318 [Cubamyces sp. BRFM 1775]|nr:hypothetical protein GY45DRAFT_53318 [Cubamyces sp. BRFM 1775]
MQAPRAAPLHHVLVMHSTRCARPVSPCSSLGYSGKIRLPRKAQLRSSSIICGPGRHSHAHEHFLQVLTDATPAVPTGVPSELGRQLHGYPHSPLPRDTRVHACCPSVWYNAKPGVLSCARGRPPWYTLRRILMTTAIRQEEPQRLSGGYRRSLLLQLMKRPRFTSMLSAVLHDLDLAFDGAGAAPRQR